MASTLPIRAARTACHSLPSPAPTVSLFPRRVFSTTPSPSNAADEPAENGEGKHEQPAPRWSYTPPHAKAPFSLHMNSRRPEFHVNNKPARLDQFYLTMLGEDGDKMLPEELKWLAVTHKSFDQGRRGFNDRLAFLGKRIVYLQTSLGLVQSMPKTRLRDFPPDEFGRTPFVHPTLDGLSNLSTQAKREYVNRMQLAGLAQQYGLDKVVRWSPKKPYNLHSSGIHVVLAHTMYAIVGAISLEKGGHVANTVAQKRILVPLGLKVS